MQSNADMNFLDSLTEPQQLQVYELMAITNIEDGNVAAKLYIESDYDINRAVQKFFDRQAGGTGGMNATPAATNNNQAGQNRQQRQRPQETELHAQYRRHLQRKRRQEDEKGVSDSVKGGITSVMGGLKSFWNTVVPTAIRGETEGGEQFIAYFKKNYPNIEKQIKFNWGTFEENVQGASETKKPLLVYLHLDSSVFNNIPNALFHNKNLTTYMNTRFHLLGLLVNTQESEKVIKFVETKNCPCLASFRVNLFDETVLAEFITLTNESTPEEVLEALKNLEKNYYAVCKEEVRIKTQVERQQNEHARRLEQMSSPFFMANQQLGFVQQQPQRREVSAEEQARLEEARVLRHIQQEEYKEVERQIMEAQQKSLEEEKLRKEKAEQEEAARLHLEEEERKKTEQKELNKRLKLENLAAEPAEGEANIIKIIFRIPNGDRIERRFLQSDKAGVLYDYIDTKDVEFDSSTVRYDLMQPRPFLCLDDKEKTIGEYFEGSDSEVVVVREHTE